MLRYIASMNFVSACVLACVVGLCTRSVEAQTFTSNAFLVIPAIGTGPGPASIYPSTITVSGLTRPVGEVTVTLRGLSHTFPTDIEALLVGPSGQKVVVMANLGGSCHLNSVDVTIADGGAIMTQACITTGVYRPGRVNPVGFNSPAPAEPYSSSLTAFAGTQGNGTWSLYIMDDAGIDTGSMAGWSITFDSPSVTYQGRLEDGGVPVTDSVDLRFTVFDAPTGGVPQSIVNVGAVPVQNGLFTAELPLSPTLFDRGPKWLEIAVRRPAGSALPFTALSGRQLFSEATKALRARTANWADVAALAENAFVADEANAAVTATKLVAPGTSPISAITVATDGRVGIPSTAPGMKLNVSGTTQISGDAFLTGSTFLSGNVSIGPLQRTPATLLHVSDGTSLAPPQAAAQMIVENDSSTYINLLSSNASEHGLTFGSPASSIHGGVYYTNSAGMDFRTGVNLSRMTINSLGNVGIGVGVSGGSIDAKLHVQNAGRVAKFDRGGNDGEIVAFARDDSVMGNITVASGVVSYNAFTGSHWASMDNPPRRGMLVSMTGENRRAGSARDAGEVIYGVQLTPRANDPACLGAYLAPVESAPDGAPERCHQIMSVGNGEMWVYDTGRDIRPGDLLITGDLPGFAMLDDPARFAVGHVVARAADAVRWNDLPASPGEPKKACISVLFGSFTRMDASGAAVQQRLAAAVKSLEAENVELRARLSRLESLLGGR